jgi:hypothetical protein
MRRILAAAALAAAVATPATAYASHHGSCGGVVDVDCSGYYCVMDCFVSECTLWLDPTHNPHAAFCL